MKKKIILGTANFAKGYGIRKSKGLNIQQINKINETYKEQTGKVAKPQKQTVTLPEKTFY